MARELPNSAQLEQALLGSLMIYPSVMAQCQELDLREEEFYQPNHQVLYKTMEKLAKLGRPTDLNSVVTYLHDQENLDGAGGTDYIIRLADAAISSAYVKQYVEQIKDKAQLRQIIYTSERIVENAYDNASDMDTFLDETERNLLDVTRTRRGAEFESSELIVHRVLEELNDLRNHKGVNGIATGFVDLDQMTNGFHPGDLIILAARPAMGKSALALNFASQVASRNPGAVAIFSLEMPSDSLMKRMLSAESNVKATKLRDGNTLTEKDLSRLYEAGSRMSERKIFIDDTSSIKVSQIFSKCRKLKSEYETISLVVIDYLQLISGSRQESRQQEVSDISRNLKILAKEMECPVVALSQLSRSVESRENHRPMLSDLRESGSIEQDADIVMFLYRGNYYDKDKEKSEEYEVVELNLAKHRNGSVGTINLTFEKQVSKFTNCETKFAGDDIHAS